MTEYTELHVPLWREIDFGAIHPDPLIAREVAIAALQGALTTAKNGLLRALDYRATSPEGLSIKADVRTALTFIDVPPETWGYAST